MDNLIAKIAELEADLESLRQFHVKECQEHHAAKTVLFRREAEIEELKSQTAPPSAPVVDRQPEIDALTAELDKYKQEIQLVIAQRNTAEEQLHRAAFNILEREAQIEALKNA
jgi:chromosome segregation ATPase